MELDELGNGESVGYITGEDFSMQPWFDENPLRDRIMNTLKIKDDDWISWRQYVEHMSIFNVFGSRDSKIKFLHNLIDMDNDGIVNKGDFESFLMLACGSEPDGLSDEEVVDIMRMVFESVDTVLQDCKSDGCRI